MSKHESLIPTSEASVRLGVSRERAVRFIQRGVLSGEYREGKWFARLSSVEQLAERLQEDRGALVGAAR